MEEKKQTRNSKPKIDLTGKQFGRWMALEYVKPGKWKCQCTCENHTIKLVEGRNLRSGKTLSCGCLQKEKTSEANSKNLVGQKFGMLIAKERISENGTTFYLCECECGSKNIKVDGRNLSSGHTTSCGCNNSKGEMIIASILKENNINFERQKTFKTCKDKQELPFDFYLNDFDILIEYDGQQHFQITRFGNKSEEQAKKDLLLYQKHDEIKNQWCKDNNKKLIRFSYKDFNNLKPLLEEELRCLKNQ